MLELSQLGSREDGKKHSMSSNCSTTQQKHVRYRPGGHVAIIASNTAQDKVLVPKDILASHRYGRDNAWIVYCRNFRQNGKPNKDQKSLLEVPIQIELSDALILA